MKVKALYSTCGMTSRKCYDVIDESVSYYKIVLDNGKIGIRHKCGFEKCD